MMGTDLASSPPMLHEGKGTCCGCSCCCSSPPPSWRRSVKRKLGQMEAESRDAVIPLMRSSSSMPSIDVLARVEIENECFALREALASQQKTIQELYTELDEERNASSTAANEAMSMILRLQREKAEVQMEARQFKRFAEERMEHDQQEILALEDAFYKRDQAVQALFCEIQAYKHHLLSYGINPDSVDPFDPNTPRRNPDSIDPIDPNTPRRISDSFDPNTPRGKAPFDEGNNDNDGSATPVYDCPAYDYPPLRCNIPNIDVNDEMGDFEKYAPGDTPRTPASTTHGHLQDIEQRIYRMERTPSSGQLNVLEKGVVVGNSPYRPRHLRQLSTDSAGSFINRDFVQDFDANRKRHEEFPAMVDRPSDAGRDDISDRVYTIDAVHGSPPTVKPCDDYVSTPRDSMMLGSTGVEETDVKKLYLRLQALEADRESLKQAIISMRTDSAQLVLLKEIAQNLSKGIAQPATSDMKLLKKPSLIASPSCLSLFKWVVSFVYWKKKATRSKYTFGLSDHNAGLLLLIDRSPRLQQWRCLSRRRG